MPGSQLGNPWSALSAPTMATAQPSSPYGGMVSPSVLNGYPMFSSSLSSNMVPGGYVSGNPVDSTPSMISPQARDQSGMQVPQGASSSTQPTTTPLNPWSFSQNPNSNPMPQASIFTP